MDLTIEQQKKLTEFLGEHDMARWCETHNRWDEGLDFTDWRVVGRLISKVKVVSIHYSQYFQHWDATVQNQQTHYIGNTAEEAIIMAVLAYLEGEEQ